MSNLPYIVGNWKMNGSRAMLSEARAIDRAAARFPQVQVALAPPATLINAMREAVQDIGVGGQDCHVEASGAFTGDISAPMLADAGADFTIVGHSERRAMHGESDAMVRAKAEAAQAAGLGGDSVRRRNRGAARFGQGRGGCRSAARWLAAARRGCRRASFPWPMSRSGQSAPAACLRSRMWRAMHKAIRAQLVAVYGEAGAEVRILYGGSVNAGNAAKLLAVEEVGGALVGGASLTAESFTAIIGAAGQSDEA